MTVLAERENLQARTVGEIAASLPGATAVFRRFKLDFCCGGDVPLGAAARQRGVDPVEVERELSLLQTSEEAAVPERISDLIEHILTRYHETHRRELPELVKLSRRVEAVHAAHPRVPSGLAELLHRMAGELEIHMKKEELILFPAMKRGLQGLSGPIVQMRLDHDDHGEQLRRIQEITHGLALPQEACRSWQALYAGVGKLVDDLMEHIHLENNVLFPASEASRTS